MWIAVAALLAAGGTALVYAVRIAGWSRAERLGGPVYLVPGSDSWVQVRIVPLLMTLGGGAIGFAVALLLTGWLLSSAVAPAPVSVSQSKTATVARAAPRPRRFSFARIGPLVLLVVLVIVAARRYLWP